MKEITVVCAILCDGENVLIAKRGKGIAEDIWEFPGGKVEKGESHEDACIREIKEELGLEIEVDGFVCDIIDSDFQPPVHVYAYYAHIIQGTIVLHAHSEVKWVQRKEVFQYQFQAADHKILIAIQ